jgi:hypothetical protein
MENFLCGDQNVMIGVVFEKFSDIQPALISSSFSFEEEDDDHCRMSVPGFTEAEAW